MNDALRWFLALCVLAHRNAALAAVAFDVVGIVAVGIVRWPGPELVGS
ncbi:MAG TPA: hypothetical protein VNL94_09830 [Candidatus Binatia bacterium]|nr:hypothetical protein [Candidatus Binatia bacterium]